MKYLNVSIQTLNEENAEELLIKIIQKRDSITTVFQLILDKNEIEIIQSQILEWKNIENSLKDKIRELFAFFQKINSIDTVIETIRQKPEIKEHATYLCEIICPVVKNVKGQYADQYKNIVVPFTSETEKINLTFPINEFLDRKTDVIIELLLDDLLKKYKKQLVEQYVVKFLLNLFVKEKLPVIDNNEIEETIIEYFTDIHIPRKAEAERDDDESHITLEMIREQIKLEQYDIAISYLDEYLELNPEDATAWNLKGNCLFYLEFYNEETMKCYDKAIELNNSFEVPYFNKANILSILQRYNEALEYCNKAIELDPNYQEALSLKERLINDSFNE
ncbi:hypothetical protein AGMMS50262_18260 [Bacteroidia bacterium]|nr:hypothetical protein AGMMS50262_18260 [Bacteroidia bacterium]